MQESTESITTATSTTEGCDDGSSNAFARWESLGPPAPAAPATAAISHEATLRYKGEERAPSSSTPLLSLASVQSHPNASRTYDGRISYDGGTAEPPSIVSPEPNTSTRAFTCEPRDADPSRRSSKSKIAASDGVAGGALVSQGEAELLLAQLTSKAKQAAMAAVGSVSSAPRGGKMTKAIATTSPTGLRLPSAPNGGCGVTNSAGRTQHGDTVSTARSMASAGTNSFNDASAREARRAEMAPAQSRKAASRAASQAAFVARTGTTSILQGEVASVAEGVKMPTVKKGTIRSGWPSGEVRVKIRGDKAGGDATRATAAAVERRGAGSAKSASAASGARSRELTESAGGNGVGDSTARCEVIASNDKSEGAAPTVHPPLGIASSGLGVSTAGVQGIGATGRTEGGVRLAQLCKEDKAKVARLMQDLMRLRGEKDVQKARFERLREQNELIVREMAGLKVKFGQSMQLLRKYQSVVQESEAGLRTTAATVPAPRPILCGDASGGGIVDSGADGVGRHEGSRGRPVSIDRGSADALSRVAKDKDGEIQALREALRSAEESARGADEKASREKAGREAGLEEIRILKGAAEGLRGQLQRHQAAIFGTASTTTASTTTPVHEEVDASLITSSSLHNFQQATPPLARRYASHDCHHPTHLQSVHHPSPLGESAKSSLLSVSGPGGDREGRSSSSVHAGDNLVAPTLPTTAAARTPTPAGMPLSTPLENGDTSRVDRPEADGYGSSRGGGASYGKEGVDIGDRQGFEHNHGRIHGECGGADCSHGADTVSPGALSALKEQVEVLKQELAMVGVQQLAITGVPTGSAVFDRGRRRGTFIPIAPCPQSTTTVTTAVTATTTDDSRKTAGNNHRVDNGGVEGLRSGKRVGRDSSNTAVGDTSSTADLTLSATEGEGTRARDAAGSRRGHAIVPSHTTLPVTVAASACTAPAVDPVDTPAPAREAWEASGEREGQEQQEDGIGWWAQSADKLLLVSASETEGDVRGGESYHCQERYQYVDGNIAGADLLRSNTSSIDCSEEHDRSVDGVHRRESVSIEGTSVTAGGGDESIFTPCSTRRPKNRGGNDGQRDATHPGLYKPTSVEAGNRRPALRRRSDGRADDHVFLQRQTGISSGQDCQFRGESDEETFRRPHTWFEVRNDDGVSFQEVENFNDNGMQSRSTRGDGDALVGQVTTGSRSATGRDESGRGSDQARDKRRIRRNDGAGGGPSSAIARGCKVNMGRADDSSVHGGLRRDTNFVRRGVNGAPKRDRGDFSGVDVDDVGHNFGDVCSVSSGGRRGDALMNKLRVSWSSISVRSDESKASTMEDIYHNAVDANASSDAAVPGEETRRTPARRRPMQQLSRQQQRQHPQEQQHHQQQQGRDERGDFVRRGRGQQQQQQREVHHDGLEQPHPRHQLRQQSWRSDLEGVSPSSFHSRPSSPSRSSSSSSHGQHQHRPNRDHRQPEPHQRHHQQLLHGQSQHDRHREGRRVERMANFGVAGLEYRRNYDHAVGAERAMARTGDADATGNDDGGGSGSETVRMPSGAASRRIEPSGTVAGVAKASQVPMKAGSRVDVDEELLTLGDKSVFDGSLLDLIDDLEEES